MCNHGITPGRSCVSTEHRNKKHRRFPLGTENLKTENISVVWKTVMTILWKHFSMQTLINNKLKKKETWSILA